MCVPSNSFLDWDVGRGPSLHVHSYFPFETSETHAHLYRTKRPFLSGRDDSVRQVLEFVNRSVMFTRADNSGVGVGWDSDP